MVLAASDWPAWAAFGVAALALGWQIVTYLFGREQRTEIRRLRQAQTEALLRIADSRERDVAATRKLEVPDDGTEQRPGNGDPAALPPPPPPPEGANLSAVLRSAGRGHRLVIRNLGPGAAQLRTVEAPDDPEVLVETGVWPGDPVDLLPGEEYTIVVALSFGTNLPLRVELTWLDSGGMRRRVQRLNPE